jgi:cytochrome c oxidase assembly protein subunit 15
MIAPHRCAATLGGAARNHSHSEPAPVPDRRPAGLWLLGCAAMVLVMAVLGAITRLTESGLSIMEWAPLSGALPPLSEAEWQRLFALYRETGEYRQHGGDMGLGEFQAIFWWEYLHRLWGRLIAVVFGGGLVWFLATRRIGRREAGPLALLFALGALQGLVGWYMVASGFSGRTDVSQYRLVIHLSLAVAIYAALLWAAFGLLEPRPKPGATPQGAPPPAWPRRALAGLVALIVLTLVAGGFVAGLDAGLIYNDFPTMGGALVPGDYAAPGATWLANAFENPVAAQLHHRVLAAATLIAALALWLAARGRAAALHGLSDRVGLVGAIDLVGLAALLQFALGVATLLLVVPVWLGALHQAGALLLLAAALRALHRACLKGDMLLHSIKSPPAVSN